MSNLTVRGNTSGTGTIILESPNTNSNRTITLPDATATLATTADFSTTLLGTIATTSGSSVTLSGLNLTGYRFVWFSFENVSGTATSTAYLLLNSFLVNIVNASGASDYTTGAGTINLTDGSFFCGGTYYFPTATPRGGGGMSGVTTASTSITFTISAGNFDAGSIRIYGVK